ncbi:MAG TPA: response regulator [Azospirillaceae bacterium]|nr:response regulator [Azospirillaceae bacterium]
MPDIFPADTRPMEAVTGRVTRIERCGPVNNPPANGFPIPNRRWGFAMRILVVEDEGLVAMALAAALTHAGHDVVGCCATLNAALRAAASHRPDLALVDVDLHGRPCGLAAVGMLREAGVPCILVTAREVVPAADVLGVIRKPYSYTTVSETVRRLAERVHAGT